MYPRRALTEEEAATYIGMSRSFLRQDRMNGPREQRTPGPRWIKVGRAVRYLVDDLDDFLNTHRVSRPNIDMSSQGVRL